MSKTITLRLSDNEYSQIASSATAEHRPISNFITHAVLEKIEESLYTDSAETAEIKSDEKLLQRLKRGHGEVKHKKGKFIE